MRGQLGSLSSLGARGGAFINLCERGCGVTGCISQLLTFLNLSPAVSWLPFFPCGPSQSYKRAIGEVSERGLLAGSPSVTLPLLWYPLYYCPLPSFSHSAHPLQDFVLLKERTLDEAPRPPKKAMDYSSSSEEVESSEDDEEESNGEPSEGSRDTPGTRYGGTLGVGHSHIGGTQKEGLQVEGDSRAGLRASGSPLPRVRNPGCQCWSVLPLFL